MRSGLLAFAGTARRADSRGAGGVALLLAAALIAVLPGACAKTEDVERANEANLVQDRRLQAIESDVGKTLREQGAVLEQIRTDMRAVRGQMQLVTERSERLASEQVAITEGLERNNAEQRKLSRRVEEEIAQLTRARLEAQNDVDKMRIQLAELEALLKSPIAKLPDKTAEDKALRQAYFSLVNGEFDVAADRFEQFRKQHPKDERAVEALYRRGQAFFLLRRYDHALIPFFELVDKAPKHELATPARWMLARSLEETGDLKLAREFYAQLISDKTPYANDATRRVSFINRLFPRAEKAAADAKGGK